MLSALGPDIPVPSSFHDTSKPAHTSRPCTTLFLAQTTPKIIYNSSHYVHKLLTYAGAIVISGVQTVVIMECPVD